MFVIRVTGPAGVSYYLNVRETSYEAASRFNDPERAEILSEAYAEFLAPQNVIVDVVDEEEG